MSSVIMITHEDNERCYQGGLLGGLMEVLHAKQLEQHLLLLLLLLM